MSDSNLISNAFNFSESLSSGVDVRTGSFSVSISLGHFMAYKNSGHIVPVQLSYDASSNNDIGFGRGWSISLSRFNKDKNALLLSTGQSFQLEYNEDLGEYDIPYRKLKDIRVLYLDETQEITVLHKTGIKEFLDWETGILKKVVSPSGLEVNFEYSEFNLQQVLWHVFDNAGREIIIDWWTDDWETTVENILDSKVYQRFTINKTGNGNYKRLSSIIFPELNDPTTFDYRYIASADYDVIEKVVHASGLIEDINYLDKGQLLPLDAPLSSVPCVLSHTINPGVNQAVHYSCYEYSDKNYLGFGCDRAWIAGEDTLFKSDNDYRYTTTETVNDSKVTVREYNKYHLLECASYFDNNNLYKREDYQYFADLELGIESQPATYSLLKEQTTTHYFNGSERSFTKQYNFDEFGNQTLESHVDGSKVIWNYYPASGEGSLCPADPHGMVSLIKEEIVVPVKTADDEQERKTIMTYRSLPCLNDSKNYFIVPYEMNKDNCSKSYDYYEDKSNIFEYGRLRVETTVVNQFSSQILYRYDFNLSDLKTTLQTTTYDGITFTESKCVDYFFGHEIEAMNSQGVVIRSQYDSLGRQTSSVVAPDTDFEASKVFSYQFESGNNSVKVTDTKGNVVVQNMNNAGKLISVEMGSMDDDLRVIHEFQYDEFGLLKQQLDTDWIDNSPITVGMQFTYDVYGNINTVMHQDGRQEIITQDPIELKTIQRQVGLLSQTTIHNLSGLEVRKETHDGQGNLRATSVSDYDGFGNLRFVTDTLGKVIEHRYDNFDRIYETQREIDGEKIIESFSYPEFTSSPAVCHSSVNNIEVGFREFDGLLRVKNEVSAGGSKSYSYKGAETNPEHIKMPDNNTVNILQNIYLNKPDSISIPGQPEMTNIYQYDKETADLNYSINQGSENTYTTDSMGRLIKEKIQLNDGTNRQASYKYSLLGKLCEKTDFFGNKTVYQYDSLGRIASITDTVSDQDTSTYIDYDQYSRAYKYTTRYKNDEAVVELVFDGVGLEISRIARFNGVEEFTIEQQYNESMLLEMRSFRDTNGQTTETFRYDDLYRLINYRCDGPHQPLDDVGNKLMEQEFNHDIYGNITKVVSRFFGNTVNTCIYTYDPNNPVRLISIKNSHPSYPAEVILRYDVAGNLLNDEKGNIYSYNTLNQVTSVKGNNGKELSRYTYDSHRRVVSQTVEDSLIYLFYCNDVLSNEFSNGAHSSYHRPAKGLIGRTVSQGKNTKNQILFGNSQGSIVETLSEQDNTSNRSKETRSYTPYGEG